MVILGVWKMKRLIVFLMLFCILFSGSLFLKFTPKAAAVNVSDSSDIILDVGEKTLIDLTPSSFSWGAIDPGSTGSIKQAQIENIGSTNLTKIWFNVTQPSSNPYGTGSNGSYRSSNFVWISKESGNYYAVDRLEFNETRSLVYLTDPDGNMPPNETKFSYGRFRNASFEYFWFLDKSGGNCDGATFYLGDVAHSKEATGTINFDPGGGCTSGLNNAPGTTCRSGALTDAGNNWCYADANIGGDSYVIGINNTDLGYAVRWSHWNQDFPGADSASNDETFYSGLLYPGNSTVANITVYLSRGVAKGRLNTGTLFVIGTNE